MDRLETEVSELMTGEGIVLLELRTALRNGRMGVRVIADRKQEGLTIDDCARLSREIRNLILERKLIDRDFTLEVSSPGLDYPLRELWQFEKNRGRLLKIRIPGDRGPKEVSGRLTGVEPSGITLTSGKKEIQARYEELLSARVLPEFKPPRMES